MSDVITEYRIARALKSGPPAIREGAKVVEMGADGTVTVLREGTNGWRSPAEKVRSGQRLSPMHLAPDPVRTCGLGSGADGDAVSPVWGGCGATAKS
jgi:hypothetical protein